MTTITRERLEQIYAECEERDPAIFEIRELVRIALASIEAEPVLYAAEETLAYARQGELHLTCLSEPMGDAVIPLFAATPAPVVPEELLSAMEEVLRISDRDHEAWHKARNGIVSCRAAMLQGSQPVSNRDELPLNYLQGHKDGLEWAAQMAEANHPQTGDWLYDDPIELAKAIRNGPDMPEGGNSPVTPEVQHWPRLRVVVNGERWHLYSPEYHYGDSTFSFYFYARNRAEAEDMLSAIRETAWLPEGEIIGFSDHEPTEAEMFAADTNDVADNDKIH